MNSDARSLAAAQGACRARRECDRYEFACGLALLAKLSAHAVSNPLNTLSLNVELASSRTSEAPVREALGRAMLELDRCVEASRALVGFASMPAHQPVSQPLDRLVSDACGLVRDELDAAGVQLAEEIDRLPSLALDAVAVRTSLVVLARDAGERGGAGTSVRVFAAPAEGGVVLRVEDDAPTLPAALVRRTGDPLDAPDPVTARHVLGIGVAREAVTRHGGTLEVRARDGGGTSVELRFEA